MRTMILTVRILAAGLALLGLTGCVTAATHYRLPPESTGSLGVSVRFFWADDDPLAGLVLHGKVKAGQGDEFFLEAVPWVWDLGGLRHGDRPLGLVETGWIRYFQPGAWDGGFYTLSLAAVNVEGNIVVPDLKTGVGVLRREGNLILLGNLNTSVWKLVGSVQRTGGWMGTPQGGWAGILPFALEAGLGYQGLYGGALGVVQLDKVPSANLEVFLTP